MKQKLFLSLLFVLALFALTSCDSLWSHESEKAVEISFTIPQEWLDSFKEEAEASQMLRSISGGPRLLSSNVDTSITAHASIIDAETDIVIAKTTVNIGNNLNKSIKFQPLYIVGQTVYAQVELTQYPFLPRIEQSKTFTVVDGTNPVAFDMGDAELNITKMSASYDDVTKILTVRPDPSSKVGLKAAMHAVVDVVGRSNVNEIHIFPPVDGKIIPEVDLSSFLGNKNYSYYNNLRKITGLEHIETVYVTDMSFMFSDAGLLSSLDLSNWNTSRVTNMRGMFTQTDFLSSLDLSGWDTSSVTNMRSMFSSTGSFLTKFDLTSWDTSSVTDMSFMFYTVDESISLDLSSWDTSNVTDMSSMFRDVSNLKSLNVSGWDTSKVINMSAMFQESSAPTSLDLSGWDTSNVENMSNMFLESSAPTSLDLRGWDTRKVTASTQMFAGSGLTSATILTDGEPNIISEIQSQIDVAPEYP